MVPKKPVIAVILFFGLAFCFGATSAQAQFWPFGKKQPESSAAQTQDNKPGLFNIFNKKENKKKGAAGKTWPMTSKKPAAGRDVVVNGVTIKGLKEEMMYSSYAPKTPEEIGAIAMAHTSWHAGTLNDMQKAAEARMATADLRSAQGLADLQAGKYAVPVPIMNSQAAGANGAAGKPVKRQIYNKPILTKPSKVFTDYR